MNPKVAVFGTLRFPPENMPQILPYLRTLVQETYASDGCIAYDVAEDPFDPGLIRFSELWPSQESLTKHLAAPHIEPWRNAAKKYGLLSRQFMSYEISNSKPV